MSAPVIAVTAWRRALPTYLGAATDLVTLGAEYAAAIERAGGIPVLVAGLAEAEAPAVLDRVDGVLLTGGQDVGGPAAGDLARDEVELALLAGAWERGTPVFGICRGLQIANVFHGGTLVADLPQTAEHPHAEGEAQSAVRHPIAATAEWVAASFPGDAVVNSIHHQAVDRLGEGLAVAASAPDGVVEAIESTDPGWFLRAVQWHPEKLPGATGAEHANRLLAPFIAAAAGRPAITERNGAR